jgi:hypothetical protein
VITLLLGLNFGAVLSAASCDYIQSRRRHFHFTTPARRDASDFRPPTAMHRKLFFLLLAAASILASSLLADDAPPAAGDREALAASQDLVGKWRGVGQVRRGSNDGSWVEKQEWVWKFGGEPSSAALSFAAKDGKYLQSGDLVAAEGGKFKLSAKTAKGEEVTYDGQRGEDGKLTLMTAAPPEGAPARITLKFTAGGDRLIVLYEKKAPVGESFTRMAEVGYTREGSGFGKGTSYIECIVTGGKGVIPVTHDGKKYFVCCSGCKELFDQDPAAAVADYVARKAAEKEEAQKGE